MKSLRFFLLNEAVTWEKSVVLQGKHWSKSLWTLSIFPPVFAMWIFLFTERAWAIKKHLHWLGNVAKRTSTSSSHSQQKTSLGSAWMPHLAPLLKLRKTAREKAGDLCMTHDFLVCCRALWLEKQQPSQLIEIAKWYTFTSRSIQVFEQHTCLLSCIVMFVLNMKSIFLFPITIMVKGISC